MELRRSYFIVIILAALSFGPGLSGCSEIGMMSAAGEEGSSSVRPDMDGGGVSDGDVDGDMDFPGVDEGEEGSGDTDMVLPRAGQLTAGEWRDLDNWNYWTGLVSQAGAYATVLERWNYHTLGRISVVVTNGPKPVVDAQVVLRSGQVVVWEARTNNKGEAELFPGMFGADAGPFDIEVTSGNNTANAAVASGGAEGPVEIQLDGNTPAQVLDLMFVVDTTGSMADELSYLQSELTYVVNAVSEFSGQDLEIRTSVNFYRDVSDTYVVRSSPFTTSVQEANDFLASTGAGGGGDIPEAVDLGLDDAIHEHSWSESAVSRLLFLVLDAPPHQDQQSLTTLQLAVEDAAAMGVRIVPVASSGVDTSTEFLLRALAIATGGTYTFLTDDSGIGGDHLEPTIGHYDVEYLNDLLVRIINESL